MARRFALSGLLRVRAIAEDMAAADLAVARRAELVAHERATETARMLGDSVPPTGADLASWQAGIASRLAWSALLIESEEEADRAAAVTAERVGAWSQARRATRSVERLAERHEQAVRLEEDRAEQRVLDDIAVRRPTEVLT